jgi:hypothetical protein
LTWEDFDVAVHWRRATSALDDAGVFLPQYQKKGSLFTVHNDGQLTLTQAMPSSMEKYKHSSKSTLDLFQRRDIIRIAGAGSAEMFRVAIE